MINKKLVLFSGAIISVIFLLFTFATELGICSLSYESCFETYDKVAEALFIFIPTLILSLITYKMREEVFRSWLKFAYIWVPLTLLLTFLAPEYDVSLVPITKSVVSFSMSAAFLIISLVIIFVKYRKTR